jgi:thiol-disulfide isomerase/thioredoxin
MVAIAEAILYPAASVSTGLQRKWRVLHLLSAVKTSHCGMEGDGDSVKSSAADNLKVFESGELLSKDGPVSARDALKGKYVGVYFSASWCPPCQRFTPKLVEAYTDSLKGKNLEIVFVSAGSASLAR